MKVLKFGGTSVGDPNRIKKLYEIISSQSAGKKMIVLSAVSGTTNSLISVAESFKNEEKEEAIRQINSLHQFYNAFIEELFTAQNLKQSAQEVVKKHFDLLKGFANDLFTSAEEKVILAQGELISTFLFQLYLQEIGVKSVLLSAFDFMRINEDGEPEYDYIKANLNTLLNAHAEEVLFITQGYICRNAFGQEDNLRRGGSDYSASLIGAAVNADEIQIWTDIDGLHNNDPRFVNETKPIRFLSFNQAAELAYFGAKILHPQSIYPAQKNNIPVRLLNTLNPSVNGTLITNSEIPEKVIVAVAAKDGITAIRIKSSRMLMTYGFLRKIFEVFERYKTPIDMITTSEVAVSLTIDNNNNLDEITKELSHYGDISINVNQTIVCVVGDFRSDTHGHVCIVLDALKHLPIRMISYGGSNYNISLLIPDNQKVEALRALHNRLF